MTRTDSKLQELIDGYGQLSESERLRLCEDATKILDTEPTVIMPLGWGSGHPLTLEKAISQLGSEMLGHAADLEESARRAKNDPGKYDQTPETMAARADDLRRYGWAAFILGLQARGAAPADPGEVASMKELAEKYKLMVPPEWIKD